MGVKVSNVSYGYDAEKVLNNIDFELIGPGLTCIIGPNGVGKSTLVKCMNRVLSPDEGRVEIDGKEVREYKLSELAKFMAFVPVASENDNSMNVLETVLMGRHPHQSFGSRNDDIHIAYQALGRVGIADLALRDAGSLSAGQQQKVAIAKGIAQEPKILILDEPTANLDIRHQILITKMLRGLAASEGMAVLMISHDLNIASRYGDRIIVMAKPGVIYSIGTPNEVITEKMLDEVYGVKSTVIDVGGRPHVILLDAE